MNSMNYSTENYCKEENNLLFEENVASFPQFLKKCMLFVNIGQGLQQTPRTPNLLTQTTLNSTKFEQNGLKNPEN